MSIWPLASASPRMKEALSRGLPERERTRKKITPRLPANRSPRMVLSSLPALTPDPVHLSPRGDPGESGPEKAWRGDEAREQERRSPAGSAAVGAQDEPGGGRER